MRICKIIIKLKNNKNKDQNWLDRERKFAFNPLNTVDKASNINFEFLK